MIVLSASMRRVWQIVLLTSAIWFFLDVFALFFLLDVKSAPNSRGKHFEAKEEEIRPEQPAEERTDVVFPTLKEKSVDEGILAKLMKGLRLDGGGPGEMGKAVKLGKEEEAEMKEKFKLNQFNLMASDMISLNRSLPDVRNSHCRKQSYEGVQMPHTSVVIVFHNEAWSTLLRSLHSVINRSPRSLLREFVLVDDCSDRDYLRGALDFYVKTLPIPTKIIHLPNRKGLVYARLQGAKVASGAVLTFLDAHIEVTTGWLEPLLSRIAEDRTRVVCPVIDVISDDTFEYVSASDMTWGGFNWKLQFRWYSVPQREIARRNGDRSKPLRSPTMAGGLFSIDKSYFYEVGSYDDGMKIWGGENLEMSFRVWQCGGSVEICPCSHVGHVFRKQTPYSFPGGTAAVIHGNAARTAEVWMDSGYKNFFYAITPGAKAVDIGSVVERLEFRKKKQCKSFKWYLENIYPEGHIPITYYSLGWVRNVGERSCLDTMSRKDGQNAGASGCHGLGGNQAWSLTGLSEIRNDESCLESVDQRQIRLQKCHKAKGNQEWFYDPQTKLVKHVSSGKCISVKGEEITLDTCTAGASSQMWTFENFDPNMHQTDGSDGEKL